MLIYLDANIVIYAIENPAVFGPRAQARLQAISRADRIAASELTRMECCNHPLRMANFALLRRFDAFFARPDVTMLPIADPIIRRATALQAHYDFATVDSIHLAAAIDNGCQVFLTNDHRLDACTDLTIEVLP